MIKSLLITGLSACVLACATSPPEEAETPKLVKYSYEGPPMTVFTGAVPPWNTESRVTGYFIAEEIPPSTTVDYLDPDIDWPFVNLPVEFMFTDGARSITKDQLEVPMKDTGMRIDPNIYEVRTFNVKTDENGDIIAWDILFVHDVRRNTFLTAHNGGIYGQDLIEVDATHFGCVATEKCTANANYTAYGAVLPDTQYPGAWTRTPVEQTVADSGE